MKADSDSRARKMLKLAGLYCTRSRLAILKVLIKAHKPLTQEQISHRLGRTRLDRVTVYRALQSFYRTRLVHKAYLQKRTWHFELADHCTERQCHPHFTCNKCGMTQCLINLSVPIVKGLGKGFIIQRQQVRLEGLCPKCA